MKKILLFIFMFFMFPCVSLAYSEYVIPGGENVGIKIESKGLIVVGFYKVNGKYIGEEGVKIGDKIIKVENKEVNSIKEMQELIKEKNKKDNVKITINRDGNIINSTLKLGKVKGSLKSGLFIKDGIEGIGTISYIDPNTKIYGALGHEVIESNTEQLVEVKNGNIFDSIVTGIDRSVDGNPGSKNADIMYEKKLGNINKNTIRGVYGIYNNIPNKKALNVAKFSDIKKGKARVYTTIEDKKLISFDITITDIDKYNKNTSKAFSFLINDKRILDKTGGIVQGMSGSPIIQNNKVIGAITHVVVDDVTKGYAIFIRSMLSEGEK